MISYPYIEDTLRHAVFFDRLYSLTDAAQFPEDRRSANNHRS